MAHVMCLAEVASEIIRALPLEQENIHTFAALHHFTRAELEVLYAVGYRLLTSSKPTEAQAVFRSLCLLDHLTEKYWLALAAAEDALHHCDNVQTALDSAAFCRIHGRQEATP
ncbi:MAG: hypothetical protein IJV69_01330 [Kiritimatiellae bacterium]|nr:hypothetical protein [Kiritimatiellia bacterium]